jgi:hypothetical protein
MIELLKKHSELNNEIKRLTEELEAVKAELRLYMVNNNLEYYKNSNYNIYYSVQKRNSLEKDKLKLFISEEDLNKCYKTTEFTVLKVLSDEQLSTMKRFINN